MIKTPSRFQSENVKQNKANKKKGIFFINDNFTDELLEYLYLDLEKAGKDKNIKEIKIYINSNGGVVSTLFPLIDWIETCDKPVSTIVLGKAYSCGFVLLLCGTKGHRKAYNNSEILIHEVSGHAWGKSSQVKEDSKNLERINKKIKEIIKEKSKMTAEQIDKFMDSNKDIFISAKTALRYGIIDKII